MEEPGQEFLKSAGIVRIIEDYDLPVNFIETYELTPGSTVVCHVPPYADAGFGLATHVVHVGP